LHIGTIKNIHKWQYITGLQRAIWRERVKVVITLRLWRWVNCTP